MSPNSPHTQQHPVGTDGRKVPWCVSAYLCPDFCLSSLIALFAFSVRLELPCLCLTRSPLSVSTCSLTCLSVTLCHAGENLLRKSGITYTVVRPGGLTKGPALTEELVVSAFPQASQCPPTVPLTDHFALNLWYPLIEFCTLAFLLQITCGYCGGQPARHSCDFKMHISHCMSVMVCCPCMTYRQRQAQAAS